MYIPSLTFFAKPVDAMAACFAAMDPQNRDAKDTRSITSPIVITYFMLPVSSPLSMIAAIRSGMIISKITSKTIKIGAEMAVFLYSPI